MTNLSTLNSRPVYRRDPNFITNAAVILAPVAPFTNMV